MIRLAADRTLGRRFVDELRAGGLDVTTMADVWGDATGQRTDIDWIRLASARRRVLLTADESIRYLKAKRDAIMAVRLQILCFPHSALSVAEQARRVLDLRPAIERLTAGRPGPWVATLYDHRATVTWPSAKDG